MSSNYVKKKSFFIAIIFYLFFLSTAPANSAAGENNLTKNLHSVNSYIVELKEMPLAVKERQLKDVLSPKNPISNEISKHKQKIKLEHDEFKKNKKSIKNNRKSKITGNAVSSINAVPDDKDVIAEYANVFNGFVLNITREEAQDIKLLTNVKSVYPNLAVHSFLMNSVPLIGADKVWQLDSDGNKCAQSGKECLTGKGIRIGIIDTGVDYTHPDLGGCFGQGCKVSGGFDFINNDRDPMDDNGHGTHVASTAAGNGVLKGVAPDAKIFAYKVLDLIGYGDESGIISAIDISIDPNQDGNFADHLDIISISIGAFGDPDDPMSRSIDNAVWVGVTAVIAAGNDGPFEQTISSPGTSRKAITVGAYNGSSGLIAGFSSRGPVVDLEYGQIQKPDLVAPGVKICAARLGSIVPRLACFDDRHIELQGTSMATPHVAGASALLLQAHPNWTPEEIKEALKGTSINLGFDANAQGSGLIAPLAAISLKTPPSIADLATYGMVRGTFNILGTATSSQFRNYRLELGYGSSPADWELLIDSSSQIKKGVLYGNFDSSLKVDGIYKLRLTVYLNDGSAKAATESMLIDNVYINNPVKNQILNTSGIIDVKGSAAGTIFRNYTIDYGVGMAPPRWLSNGVSLTLGGKSALIDQKLGSINLSTIKSLLWGGIITIRLVVNNADGLVSEDRVSVSLVPLQLGWPQEIGEQTYSTPSIADVDGNGDLEIAIGSNMYDPNKEGRVYLFNHDGTIYPGWPKTTSKGVYASPALADLNEDGKLDIIAVDFDGKIYAWNPDGSTVAGWPYQTTFTLTAIKPTVSYASGLCYNSGGCNGGKCDVETFSDNGCNDTDGNVNFFLMGITSNASTSKTDYCSGDTVIEYLCVQYTHRVYEYNYTCPYGCSNGSCNSNPSGTAVYGCIDTDGGDNQFQQGSATILGNGTAYQDFCRSNTNYLEYYCDISKMQTQSYHGKILSSPAIADIDGDGHLDVAVGIEGMPGLQPDGRRGNNQFYVLNHNGTLMKGWPKSISIQDLSYTTEVLASTAIADLDNNGKPEIISGNYGFYIYAWHHNGSDVAGWPQYVGKRSVSTAAVGDLLGDGGKEIIAISAPSWDPAVTIYNSEIHAYMANGHEISGFPISLPDGIKSNSPPVIGDINNDGKPEIIVVSSSSLIEMVSHVYAFAANGSLMWTANLLDHDNLNYNSDSGAIIADIDNDTMADIFFGAWHFDLFTFKDTGKIFGFHGNGSPIAGFPLESEGIFGGMALDDLNLDGNLDLAFGTETGKLYVYDLEKPFKKEKIQWGKEFHDVRNMNYYSMDNAVHSCPWDFISPSGGLPDGKVGLGDILFVLKDYGKKLGDVGYNPKKNFNTNPQIDLGDVLTVLAHFGECI